MITILFFLFVGSCLFIRALELFASELEKLRNKIKSASSKRSSEILKSAVADVHLQLQNAETQVQTDM